MDVYNLGKTEMILDIPWLVAYNLEIDWEKGEIKMTWCSPIYRKRKQETQERRQVRKIEKEKKSRGISTQEILEVKESIWKGKIRENTHQKAMGPCNRVEKKGLCQGRKKYIHC